MTGQMTTINPATGETIETYSQMTNDEAQNAVPDVTRHFSIGGINRSRSVPKSFRQSVRSSRTARKTSHSS